MILQNVKSLKKKFFNQYQFYYPVKNEGFL
jgi:hypothetical protein